MDFNSKDHWKNHAAQWNSMGPPLRPCYQDIKIFERIVARQERKSIHSLILGVTPEIALMRWPSETKILAIDNCISMIANVWPGQKISNGHAVCGDWRSMPVNKDTADVVIGDGCFTPLKYPDEYRQVSRSIYDSLKPGGCLILRFFIRPEEDEKIETIHLDVKKGKIKSFHTFKWRLAMALHGSNPSEGVRLDDIWQAWHDMGFDSEITARESGWPKDVQATINSYCGASAQYSFPSRKEISQIFSGTFIRDVWYYGNYELSQCCPIVVFTPDK